MGQLKETRHLLNFRLQRTIELGPLSTPCVSVLPAKQPLDFSCESPIDRLWPIHLRLISLANLVCVMVWPRRVEPRRVGSLKGEGPKPRKMEPRRVAQHFALFLPLPPQCHSFLPSLGGPRGILVVFEVPAPSKCARLEFSGCRVKPRRPTTAKGKRGPGEEGPTEGVPRRVRGGGEGYRGVPSRLPQTSRLNRSNLFRPICLKWHWP